IRDARRLLRLQNFAARALTQSAAKEYACAGVIVNAHCPGVVGTDMWVTIDERFSEVTGEPKGQTYQQFVAGIAFGRAQTSADGRRLRVLPGRPGLGLHDWAGRPHRREPSLPGTTENLRPPHRTTGTHRVRRNHDAPRLDGTYLRRPPTNPHRTQLSGDSHESSPLLRSWRHPHRGRRRTRGETRNRRCRRRMVRNLRYRPARVPRRTDLRASRRAPAPRVRRISTHHPWPVSYTHLRAHETDSYL